MQAERVHVYHAVHCECLRLLKVFATQAACAPVHQHLMLCCRYMAVAKPGLEKLTPDDVKLFKVKFGEFVKLHEGTWHAGPHFQGIEHMDFYNLELADTNQTDHHNHHFDQENGIEIAILPC